MTVKAETKNKTAKATTAKKSATKKASTDTRSSNSSSKTKSAAKAPRTAKAKASGTSAESAAEKTSAKTTTKTSTRTNSKSTGNSSAKSKASASKKTAAAPKKVSSPKAKEEQTKAATASSKEKPAKKSTSLSSTTSKKQQQNEPAATGAPAKITSTSRKAGSKGQTKEEQAAKKLAFNTMRAEWFDRYMKGTLPGLYELRISTDRNKLLSEEEQLKLAEFIQAGIAAKSLLNKIEQLQGKEEPVHLQKTVLAEAPQILECLEKEGYSAESYVGNRREVRKIERLVTQAEKARYVFAEKNLGLVTMLAGRLKKQSNAAGAVDFDDLVAEGMNGLMIAIDHYDPSTGFKFSTPATWWINQPILNYLDSKTKTIHMPSHMNKIYKAIHFAKRALREKYPNDEDVTNERIAEYCQSKGYDNITVEKIEEALMYRRETISYDVPFNEGGSNDKSLSEIIDSGEDISLDVLDKIGGRDNFNRMLALVDDDKKREILRDWYSSKDMHDIVILSNVSRKHCLTKERVRQLKQEGEKELSQKISDLAKEKGVSLGEAVMVDGSEELLL